MSHLKEAVSTVKQLIVFQVSLESYALELLNVQEIIRIPHITRLPKASAFIKGMVDLRGNIIVLIDLREKFGLDTRQYTRTTRVIIIETSQKLVGLIVDIVSKVICLPEGQILPPPEINSNTRDNIQIDGVARFNDELIIILNADSLFTYNEVQDLVEAATMAKKYAKQGQA
ncbi:MAG: chemotaxis protein CheW [Spirochaetota bacterium]|nr:chemotaxis protein CheW [Spirochaetota bacterium]